MPFDFEIERFSSISIKEPRIKTKIKFLQKIFIKLFGYKEVCQLRPCDITEIICDDKVIYRKGQKENE